MPRRVRLGAPTEDVKIQHIMGATKLMRSTGKKSTSA